MQLEITFEEMQLHYQVGEMLAHWVKLKKSEGVSLNTFDVFDGDDGSGYYYEFEDWLLQQVSSTIKDDCDSTDWHILAQSIGLAFAGSDVPRVQCQSQAELVTD